MLERIPLGLYSLQSLLHADGKSGVQGFIIITHLFKPETVKAFFSSNLWFLAIKFSQTSRPLICFILILHVPVITYPKFISRCSSQISLFYCFLPTCFSLHLIGTTYLGWEDCTYFIDFTLDLYYSLDTFYWVFVVQSFKNTITNCSVSISSYLFQLYKAQNFRTLYSLSFLLAKCPIYSWVSLFKGNTLLKVVNDVQNNWTNVQSNSVIFFFPQPHPLKLLTEWANSLVCLSSYCTQQFYQMFAST